MLILFPFFRELGRPRSNCAVLLSAASRRREKRKRGCGSSKTDSEEDPYDFRREGEIRRDPSQLSPSLPSSSLHSRLGTTSLSPRCPTTTPSYDFQTGLPFRLSYGAKSFPRKLPLQLQHRQSQAVSRYDLS